MQALSPVKFGATYFYHDDDEKMGRNHAREIATLLNGEAVQLLPPEGSPKPDEKQFVTFRIKTPDGIPNHASTRTQFLQELEKLLTYVKGQRNQTTKVYVDEIETRIRQAKDTQNHFAQEASFSIELD